MYRRYVLTCTGAECYRGFYRGRACIDLVCMAGRLDAANTALEHQPSTTSSPGWGLLEYAGAAVTMATLLCLAGGAVPHLAQARSGSVRSGPAREETVQRKLPAGAVAPRESMIT